MWELVNKIQEGEKISGEHRKSTILLVCKQKGCILKYGNYRRIKIIAQELNLLEKWTKG